MEIKLVKAKKEYKCDRTGKTIKVGEKYQRVNIRNVGIFHFKLGVPEHYIRSRIESAATYSKITWSDGENGEW